MEFITVEQFKEQPKEVQKVFLDWWKPSIGDIFTWVDRDAHYMGELACCCSELQAEVTNKNKGLDNRIPLFTEGQLRNFIEDKTECDNLELSVNPETGEYDLLCFKKITSVTLEEKFLELGADVIQAYWKVACIVAKEGLNG